MTFGFESNAPPKRNFAYDVFCFKKAGILIDLSMQKRMTPTSIAFVLLPVSRIRSVSALVAQLGERLTEYVKVLGSIPSVGRVLLW